MMNASDATMASTSKRDTNFSRQDSDLTIFCCNRPSSPFEKLSKDPFDWYDLSAWRDITNGKQEENTFDLCVEFEVDKNEAVDPEDDRKPAAKPTESDLMKAKEFKDDQLSVSSKLGYDLDGVCKPSAQKKPKLIMFNDGNECNLLSKAFSHTKTSSNAQVKKEGTKDDPINLSKLQSMNEQLYCERVIDLTEDYAEAHSMAKSVYGAASSSILSTDELLAMSLQAEYNQEAANLSFSVDPIVDTEARLTDKAWKFVERVMLLHKKMDSIMRKTGNDFEPLQINLIPYDSIGALNMDLFPESRPKQSLNEVLSKIKPVAVDDMFFLAKRLLSAQQEFRSLGKNVHVDIGYHYTRPVNMERIRTDGLMSKTERDEKGIMSRYNGSSYGDGIYTGNNPYAFHGSYGESGLIVARLRGKEEEHTLHHPRMPYIQTDHKQNSTEDVDTILGPGTPGKQPVVLRTSKQCVALIEFQSSVIDIQTAFDEACPGNEAVFQYHLELQQMIDEFFNEGHVTEVNHLSPSDVLGRYHISISGRYRRRIKKPQPQLSPDAGNNRNPLHKDVRHKIARKSAFPIQVNSAADRFDPVTLAARVRRRQSLYKDKKSSNSFGLQMASAARTAFPPSFAKTKPPAFVDSKSSPKNSGGCAFTEEGYQMKWNDSKSPPTSLPSWGNGTSIIGSAHQSSNSQFIQGRRMLPPSVVKAKLPDFFDSKPLVAKLGPFACNGKDYQQTNARLSDSTPSPASLRSGSSIAAAVVKPQAFLNDSKPLPKEFPSCGIGSPKISRSNQSPDSQGLQVTKEAHSTLSTGVVEAKLPAFIVFKPSATKAGRSVFIDKDCQQIQHSLNNAKPSPTLLLPCNDTEASVVATASGKPAQVPTFPSATNSIDSLLQMYDAHNALCNPRKSAPQTRKARQEATGVKHHQSYFNPATQSYSLRNDNFPCTFCDGRNTSIAQQVLSIPIPPQFNPGAQAFSNYAMGSPNAIRKFSSSSRNGINVDAPLALNTMSAPPNQGHDSTTDALANYNPWTRSTASTTLNKDASHTHSMSSPDSCNAVQVPQPPFMFAPKCPQMHDEIFYTAPDSLHDRNDFERLLEPITPATFSSRSSDNNNKDDECPICLEVLGTNRIVKLKACDHVYCQGCIESALQRYKRCPICRVIVDEPQGTMPTGKMTVTEELNLTCSGFPPGTFHIQYHLQGGIQKKYHPNPGHAYRPDIRTAYVPVTDDGRKLIKRLLYAFQHGLTFTIGTSLTNGNDNQITWSSIHHKTSTWDCAHGFPDPSYFMNCNRELDSLGVPPVEEL